VLARAVVWGPLEVNPAKQGADNPQRRRTDKRPFESWEELEALAERLGPRLGPMVFFAAATGSDRASVALSLGAAASRFRLSFRRPRSTSFAETSGARHVSRAERTAIGCSGGSRA
jgi:hypothetical protein